MSEQQQNSRYYDWVEGTQKVWLTWVKAERGDENKPRTKIHLQFATKPTAETFDAPSARVTLQGTLPSDDPKALIFMERRFKDTLFKVCEIPDGQKAKLSTLVKEAQARLTKCDMEVELTMKLKEGNQVDKETGNPRMFAELEGFKIVGVKAKGAFESALDCDESEIPF